MKMSSGQLERVSDICGNLAVAWFSAGIISPLFVHPENILNLVITIGISLFMAAAFFLVSVDLVKGVN